MNIKNYTSSVPAETTIAQIESKLAASGVSGIQKLYGPTGKVTSIVFKIELADKSYVVRVPANVQKCFDALWRQYCKRTSRPRDTTKPVLMAQAHRTAWKIVQEWIEIQLSMIEMEQAEFLEVFMPYLWDGKRTYFETMKHDKFKALPETSSVT